MDEERMKRGLRPGPGAAVLGWVDPLSAQGPELSAPSGHALGSQARLREPGGHVAVPALAPFPATPETPASASALYFPVSMATGRFGVGETLGALNAALKPQPLSASSGGSVWFKENSARNLRSRDFLAPRGALRALFGDGQVPKDILEGVAAVEGPGVPPIQKCTQTQAGLALQLERPTVFEQVLSSLEGYVAPQPAASASERSLVLDCVSLHGAKGPDALSLSQLRAVLVADHLAQALRTQGVTVYQVPAVQDPGLRDFLKQLKVNWPSASKTSSAPESTVALKEVLRDHAAAPNEDLPPGVVCKVSLKEFLEQQPDLEGFDPNLDICLVTEDQLGALMELQEAAQQCRSNLPLSHSKAESSVGGPACSVVHVVSCEEAFQQQKVDLLWRLVDVSAPSRQKHLVCGPVKVVGSSTPLNAPQYYRLRQAQMREASVLKYGVDFVQDETWNEIIGALTSAAVKFEMLSTAHRSQMALDLEDTSISTKGTKSGAFVMYNCARLATLFDGYQRGVEQGLYPAFPDVSELDFSLLREEGEWLLLFNGIIPFPEVLSQSAQLQVKSPGIRITANTEAVCKFLVHLSMDFSSYYNRVHILGEPQPHLFGQMFARLQLMHAVREVFHSALATLHLPPLSQI
ncbi:DALR anticodon-binding domain-containing protein 3 [Sarcophilus harrisii]|nr:DALR anticodon-binding domain-containing protein 3 [Sarcophilus harrisii]XP_031815395.1 DALR anticodon-binding domain-containing protein 3 [Sarcophilus harrisii]XP_031815403.1 DALR anticodon-binding domain-containing protein 3 [Sarcophilus harrisii]XP_031815407.1 DALR anticodon-binding domain-containing protein 3 [Sarcophilus harrisii]XP_031815415.1 DALR anticodon-binding domain-containing protein 3 [Sarcophilus harrisii]XP_031815422.1 DALR anticodon-binding domain-containing protein 3 [Sar